MARKQIRNNTASYEATQEPFAKAFDELMQEAKKQKGTSNQDIADLLDVTRQQIANYRTGRSVPDIRALVKIANYFNVSSDYLLGLNPAASPSFQYIGEYTGLNDKSIELLKTLNNSGLNSVMNDLLNHNSFPAIIEIEALAQEAFSALKNTEDSKEVLDTHKHNFEAEMPKEELPNYYTYRAYLLMSNILEDITSLGFKALNDVMEG